MGRLQAECMGKALGGKGKVAMMSFITGQIWADLRAKGFKETLAKEFPEITIVAENRLATTRAEFDYRGGGLGAALSRPCRHLHHRR